MELNILSYISREDAYFALTMAGVVALTMTSLGVAACYGELKKAREHRERRDGELEKRVGNVDGKSR